MIFFIYNYFNRVINYLYYFNYFNIFYCLILLYHFSHDQITFKEVLAQRYTKN
jgi:hypothetical protein